MALSPHAARLRFGSEIRKLRERAGLTQKQVTDLVPMTQSHLSAIETGRKGTKPDQIALLDNALSANGALIRRWEDLRRDDGYAEWFRDVVAIENEATEIRAYQSSVVPGLLQAPEYAHALIQMGRPADTPIEIKDGVEARIQRQKILTAERGPVVKVVIEEHVLRRPIGGRETLKAQLDKLLELSSLPRVTVQVVSANSECHFGMDGSFILFTVPGKGQVAYTETRVSSDPRDNLESVQDYMSVFGDLCSDALPPPASRVLIEKIRREFDA